MMYGNFFAWNSIEEFLELYKDKDPNLWEYVKGKGKPGTLISPTLKKGWFKSIEDCKKYKYVVAFNRYNGDGTFKYTITWPKFFEGKKLLFNDVTDKIFCFPTYLLFCNKNDWIYFKKNLSKNDGYKQWKTKKNRQDWPDSSDLLSKEPSISYVKISYDDLYNRSINRVLFPAPESPPAGNIKAVFDNKIYWKNWKNRKYDVFFAGQSRKGYLVGDKVNEIKKLKKAVKKLKLKALILDKSENIGRKGYMEAISNTKFCYNFTIGPVRNRREWEILLGGGLLVQDLKTKNMEKDILEKNEHFVYQSQDFEKQLELFMDDSNFFENISFKGWKLAVDCWLKIPTLEFRMFMCYLLGNKKRLRTLEDLVKTEIKLNLR